MVRPKPIPRRNRVHRHTWLQAFRYDLRLDIVRPPFLAIGLSMCIQKWPGVII
jgi:hypothetical protein